MNHKRLFAQLGLLAGGVALVSTISQGNIERPKESLEVNKDPYALIYSIIFKCIEPAVPDNNGIIPVGRLIIGESAGIIAQGIVTIQPEANTGDYKVTINGDDLARENTVLRITHTNQETDISIRDNNDEPSVDVMHEVGVITISDRTKEITCRKVQ